MKRTLIVFVTPLALFAGEDARSTAESLSNQGRHAEAVEYWESARSQEPGSEELAMGLAAALVFSDRQNEARPLLEGLRKSWNPETVRIAETSLRALESAREKEQAAKSVEANARAERDLQRQKQALLDRRQAVYRLIDRGRDEEAVRAIDALEVQGEATPDLMLEKSHAFERLGDPLAAIVVLRDLAHPENPDTRPRRQLAHLLTKLGRPGEAYEMWESLRGGPDDLEAHRAMRSLPPSARNDQWSWGELDLYGTFLSRYDIGISTGKMRQGTFVPGLRWIEPFVQADFSLDSTAGADSGGIPTIYNENLAGFHAGARVRPWAESAFVLYVLGGVQKDLRGTIQRQGNWFPEVIAGFNTFHSWGPGRNLAPPVFESASPAGTGPDGRTANGEHPVFLQWRGDWFVEAGADGAYYSRLSNAIGYGQLRQGLRIANWGRVAAMDGYAVENLTMDTRGNYYDNSAEIGPGARFVISPSPATTVTVSTDYVLGTYLGRNAGDTRGDTASNYADFRFTVALSLRW